MSRFSSTRAIATAWVGANGSGKSTFLRILTGEERDHFAYETHPILDVVMMGDDELWSAMTEKEKLLANADENFDARAGEILEGLGIASEQHREPLSTLSGGFKLRVLLAKVLAAVPDCLLLDEPTNHLDILSIRWLEKFLVDYAGTAVVISHDHRFLDNTSSAAKRPSATAKQAEIKKRERRIAEHKAFIDRFKAKATKARQAQSKMKQMERIQIDVLPQSSRRYPTFRFQQCRPSGKVALEVKKVSKAYDDNQVLKDVSLRVDRGDRIAIIGPNGIGKSTLLKIAMGEVEADSGSTEWGYEAHPGYFAQDHKEIFEGQKTTIESWLWEFCADQPVGFVRGRLGMVLFSGDEVEKKVGSVSGGESARLIFARLGVQEPNVLVLDEPTNHLDLEAIEALVKGLREFEGTLLLVSHDRWFVSQLAERIVEISANGLQDFRGSYDEYVERCGDDHLDAEQVVLKAKRDKRRTKGDSRGGNAKLDDKGLQKEHRKLTRQRDQATAEIERAEARVGEINELFCNPGFFDKTPAPETRRLEAEQKKLSGRIEELMKKWEQLEGELAELDEQRSLKV
nr:probable ATP-binding protein YbiT [Nerophis lumbriciformis]